ncbi:MAG: hypothetical protein H2069_06170 [Legionella sp.]|nr:hypothetical protein [Legionella sp.]
MRSQSEQIEASENLVLQIDKTIADGLCRFHATLGNPSGRGYYYPYCTQLKEFFRNLLDLFSSNEDLEKKASGLAVYLSPSTFYSIIQAHLNGLNITQQELDDHFLVGYPTYALKPEKAQNFYKLYQRTWDQNFKRSVVRTTEFKVISSFLGIDFFEELLGNEDNMINHGSDEASSRSFRFTSDSTLSEHPLLQLKSRFAHIGADSRLVEEAQKEARRQNKSLALSREVRLYSAESNATPFITTRNGHTSHVTVTNISAELKDLLKQSQRSISTVIEKTYAQEDCSRPNFPIGQIDQKTGASLLKATPPPDDATALIHALNSHSVANVLDVVFSRINSAGKTLQREALETYFDQYQMALRSKRERNTNTQSPPDCAAIRPTLRAQRNCQQNKTLHVREVANEVHCVQQLSKSIGTFFSDERLRQMKNNPNLNEIIARDDSILAALLQAEEDDAHRTQSLETRINPK